jgi:hypothetical protein
MSNPSVVILQLGALVANGIALSQTPGAAGNLILNGSLVTGGVAVLDVPRRVSIASSGNDAAVIFTVNGTNANGSPISSAVTGVTSTATGQTALDFKTVTSIATSAATVGAITVGTNGVASSPWVLDNHLATVWALTVAVSVTGTVTYTVEHTYDDPNDVGPTLTAMPEQWSLEPASYVAPLAWPNGTLSGKTVNGETTYADQPIMAHRLTITAGTGRAVMQSIQAGID